MTKRLNDTLRRAFVRAVMQDVPTVDYNEHMREFLQKLAISKMPDSLRRLHKTHGEWFYQDHFYTPGGFSNVMIVCPDAGAFAKAMTDDEKASMDAIVTAHANQRETAGTIESKLRALVHSVATVEALVKKAPEFAKYVTIDAPIDRTVPMIANLVADLNAAGWPKDA